MSFPFQKGFIAIFLMLLHVGMAEAENARLLPQSMSRFRFYLTEGGATGQFNNSGKKDNFTTVGANSLAASGLPLSRANIYNIGTDGYFHVRKYDLTYDYGITDNLNVGFWFPIQQNSYRSSGVLQQLVNWGALGAAQRTTISNAVTTLDLADRNGNGIGDLLLGFKQRLVGGNKDRFRLSLAGILRTPTGKPDDPLDSHDIATGDGQWDAGVWLYLDYSFTENFELNIRTDHEYQFSGTRKALNLQNTSQAIPTRFQPGFYNRVSVRPRFRSFFDGFETELSVQAIYERELDEKQQRFNATSGGYAGPMGRVSGTDSTIVTLSPRVGVNLMKSKIPLIMYLSYSKVVQGKNTLANEYLTLRLDFFFGGKNGQPLF